jgi:myo-inositol-1(or 4)-monophosphatase
MTELDLIKKILDQAAPIALEHHRKRANLKITTKQNPQDLLTQADEQIQTFITQQILQEYPQDTIIAEELGQHTLPPDIHTRRAWLIDPIDGTQNFIRGLYPAFGISIAFTNQSQTHAAGVHLPTINQQFLAQKGQGATQNGQPIQVSNIKTLDQARIEIDYGNPIHRADIAHTFQQTILQAGQVRCHCAAVVGLCSVAAGEMDAYLHTYLKPWDYAAAALILQEAGGTIQQLDTQPLNLWQENNGIIATNTHLQTQIQNTLQLPNP